MVFSQKKDIEGLPCSENILNSILYTIDNDTIIFSDIVLQNRGKIIYIKFWASWCGACAKELPYTNEIINELIDEKVVFINISTDENDKDWLKYLDKKEVLGLNYRIEKKNKSDFQNYFKIDGVPYILIMDSIGNVAINKAKYPSNPNSKTEIYNLLKQ